MPAPGPMAASFLWGTGEMLRSISQASLAKATSLLFELELGDDDGSHGVVSRAATRLAALLQPCSPEAEKLQHDAKQAAASCEQPGAKDMRAFAKALCARGYRVWLRRGGDGKGTDQGSSRGSIDDSPRSPTASHAVVIVALKGANGAKEQLFVVDPSFREQFKLSQPPSAYEALLVELPDVFVGDAEQVVAVVELMCDEMSKVFQQDNRQSPPWRQREYMLTKWLPQRAHDERVQAHDTAGTNC